MFNPKKVAAFSFLALLIGLTLVVFPSSAAQAASASHATKAVATAATCIYSSCDHKSPVSTGCQNTAIVEHYESGTIDNGIGITIQLQFSTACHAAWARVVFSKALPSGYDGYAILDRLSGSTITEVTCNDAGGNGDVLPGQTICYTPMLEDNANQSADAVGAYCVSGYGCNGPVVTKTF